MISQRLSLIPFLVVVSLAAANSSGPIACKEDVAVTCHSTAFCQDSGSGGQCQCPEGSIGDGVLKAHGGSECSRESWSLIVSLDFRSPALTASGERLDLWEEDRASFSNLLFVDPSTEKPAWFDTSMFHIVTERRYVTIYSLFETKDSAEKASATLFNKTIGNHPGPLFGVENHYLLTFPKVQTFVSKTSAAEIRVLPTGMDVENVYFRADCMTSGCWVVDLIYTTGEDNFNVFYIPKAVGNDTLSFDFDYEAIPAYAAPYGKSPADTFLPLNFPCGSDGYTYQPGPHIPDQVSACCIEEFTELYRPIDTFQADPHVAAVLGDTRSTTCAAPTFCAAEDGICTCDGTVQYGANGAFVYKEVSGQIECSNDMFTDPIVSVEKACYCSPSRKIWTRLDKPDNALFGNFSGMDGLANVTFSSVEDPFIRQYRATVFLDEVALRRRAGILSGSVGVAHAIDTFIGLANFKPSGLEFLDMFAVQTNIHLERTNFFTVSTYGENQYTFLEYVNLRLVAIYDQEQVVREDHERSRTDPANAAQYLQVTFTLGEQYQPIETGIIPIDSVLVSKGDFITSSATLETRFHACSQYLDGTFEQKAEFDSRFPTAFSQTCAPNATMCYNPRHIPDQFVSFNVPLGIDWLPEESNSLDSNVFVDMAVSVIDAHQIAIPGANPNNGDPAEQMKTTLKASIPVVEGGVYVFCDTVTRREDLHDVAKVDLIFGSAGHDYEFSRLKIIKDLAKTVTGDSNATYIDTDSIEAGLMTLVVRGNESYFGAAETFSLEVEDVITIHVMEPETGSTYQAVLDLLFAPGQFSVTSENSFPINGAFSYSVDAALSRVELQPSDDLELLCPFAPQPPSPDDAFPETCVSRRDIRSRAFPARNGNNATAIELPSADVARDDPARDDVARFMQLTLNPSDYSAELGRNFSHIVAHTYQLNGRYNRAFWINPAYEWTPQQTGGQTIFTLSQKIVMFALISLDQGTPGLPGQRRRMLLQSSTDNAGPGVSAQQATFDTSPQSLMAGLYNIPEELVGSFRVQLQLTQQEACMSPSELRRSIRATLDAHVHATTSHYETVQVVSVAVDQADVQCSARRALPRKLLAFSPASASVEMMVVFSPSDFVAINLEAFASQPGINAVQPLALSDLIQVSTTDPSQFPPTSTHRPAPSGNPEPAGTSNPPAVQPTGASGPGAEAEDGGASLDTTLLAACIGAGVVALAGLMFAYKQYELRQAKDVHVIDSINMADIKADLKSELVLP